MPKVVNKVLVLLPVILLCVVVFEGTSEASLQEGIKPRPAHTQKFSRERSDRAKIISILESRIGSHRLPEQAKEKLATMHDEELRLVAALCDRIGTANDQANDRASTDIALLLAAVLIVLS
ncbi:MAG: hypothetical protein ACM3MD_11775 [Betaproteobacteria bacterium]